MSGWTDLLSDIFGKTAPLSWSQECARAVLVLAFGLLIIRLAGRRVFGKWSALDIIVSVIVGSNLSRTLTGSAPLWGTLAATALLLALHWILARIAAHWRGASKVLEGEPVILAAAGALDQDNRKRYAVTQADLDEALRRRGIGELGATEQITLEPSGRITVLKKEDPPHPRS